MSINILSCKDSRYSRKKSDQSLSQRIMWTKKFYLVGLLPGILACVPAAAAMLHLMANDSPTATFSLQSRDDSGTQTWNKLPIRHPSAAILFEFMGLNKQTQW